jgi:hypothetical protein
MDEHFVDVVGYKGRVNVDNDGNPEIVTNDRPGMAPSDIDSLKQKRLCQWCIVCFVWLLFSFACRWQFDRLLFG